MRAGARRPARCRRCVFPLAHPPRPSCSNPILDLTLTYVIAVAKHFLSDRESFKATAKHWAQAYAQAPANKIKRAAGNQMTDAEMAGLAEANVAQFAEMGFPRDKVVRDLLLDLPRL